MKLAIVGVETQGNDRMLTMLAYKIKDGKVETKVAKMPEAEAVNWAVNNSVEVINAIPTVQNGTAKMKRLSGDLKRFEQQNFAPYVVLSELVTDTERVVGYRIADHTGRVAAIRLADIVKFCTDAVRRNRIPIQNGMFIDVNEQKRAHIKGYPECPFEKEILDTRTKAQPAVKKVEAVATTKSSMEKLTEIFTKEQIRQLKLGKEHGVDIRIYGNPAFTPEQMAVLRETMEAGLNAKLFAHPSFSVQHMKTFKADLKYGEDIRPYLNPKFTIGQISEIQAGIASGVDISTYADPEIKENDMYEVRLRLEKNIWTSVDPNRVKSLSE